MSSNLVRFNKVIEKISAWFNWIAVAGMWLMLLIITIDVIGAKAFRWPLPGVFDMVCPLEFIIVALAIPFTQILKGHVAIEFFVGQLGKRTQAVITTIAAMLALILFLAMTWQMFSYSRTIQLSGEITPSLRIPVFPITYIATLSFFLMSLLVFGEFLAKIKKEVAKK